MTEPFGDPASESESSLSSSSHSSPNLKDCMISNSLPVLGFFPWRTRRCSFGVGEAVVQVVECSDPRMSLSATPTRFPHS